MAEPTTVSEQEGSAPAQDETQEGGAPKGYVPGDALRREEKARKAAEKETAALKARLGELESAGKSELDKAREERDQLKTRAERLERYEADAVERAERLLEDLPKEAQKKLAAVLERLSDPLERITVIESIGALAKTEPRPAAGERGAPAPSVRMPSAAELNDRNAIRDLSPEQFAELQRQNGITQPGRTPFRRG
jgi:DNA repair exonuclease SbcCD ATPase subunit